MVRRVIGAALAMLVTAFDPAFAQEPDPPAPAASDAAAVARWEASAAIAANGWKRVDAADNGVYWRSATASKKRDIVSVDMRIERFVGVAGEGGALFRSQNVALQFDCSKGLMRAVKITAFEGHNLSGRQQETPGQPGWSKVAIKAPAGQIFVNSCIETATAEQARDQAAAEKSKLGAAAGRAGPNVTVMKIGPEGVTTRQQ